MNNIVYSTVDTSVNTTEPRIFPYANDTKYDGRRYSEKNLTNLIRSLVNKSFAIHGNLGDFNITIESGIDQETNEPFMNLKVSGGEAIINGYYVKQPYETIVHGYDKSGRNFFANIADNENVAVCLCLTFDGNGNNVSGSTIRIGKEPGETVAHLLLGHLTYTPASSTEVQGILNYVQDANLFSNINVLNLYSTGDKDEMLNSAFADVVTQIINNISEQGLTSGVFVINEAKDPDGITTQLVATYQQNESTNNCELIISQRVWQNQSYVDTPLIKWIQYTNNDPQLSTLPETYKGHWIQSKTAYYSECYINSLYCNTNFVGPGIVATKSGSVVRINITGQLTVNNTAIFNGPTTLVGPTKLTNQMDILSGTIVRGNSRVIDSSGNVYGAVWN